MVSGLNCTKPKGVSAPGNVLPGHRLSSVLAPIMGLTSSTSSSGRPACALNSPATSAAKTAVRQKYDFIVKPYMNLSDAIKTRRGSRVAVGEKEHTIVRHVGEDGHPIHQVCRCFDNVIPAVDAFKLQIEQAVG